MKKHVRILGWLYIAMGVLDLLAAAAIFMILSGAGAMSGDMHVFGTMSAIGGLLVTIFVVFSIPNFLCGLGFLKGWGGWVIVVACVLSLINFAKFPWGTGVALYTFWVAWKLSQAQEDSTPAASTAA